MLIAVVLAGCRSKAPFEGKSVVQLEWMLRDTNPTVQAQGAMGLAELGPAARSAVPSLIGTLESSDTLVRRESARALGKIGPDARDAVPSLVKVCSDPEWTVRREVAMALGAIGEKQDAVPALEKMQADRDNLVSKAAKESLRQLSPGSVKSATPDRK